MKKTLLILAALALFVRPLEAADEVSVRVFILKHKRVEEAALLVRPLLSDASSVMLSSKLNAMTVTDRPEKLDQIGKILESFDVPPRGYNFAVKLIRARADVPAGSISREIGGLGAKLKSLFQFNDYALIDSAVLRGVEGGTLRYQLGTDYTLSFSVRSSGSSGSKELLLSPFALSKLWKPPGNTGPGLMRQLYQTSVPITLNQTLVLGASREEGSKSALILVILAEETPRLDEKGTAGAKAAEKRP